MKDHTPDTETLFKMLGVDINSQDDINRLRADLVYARHLRRVAEATTRHAVKVLVTAVVVAIGVWIVDGVRGTLGGGQG